MWMKSSWTRWMSLLLYSCWSLRQGLPKIGERFACTFSRVGTREGGRSGGQNGSHVPRQASNLRAAHGKRSSWAALNHRPEERPMAKFPNPERYYGFGACHGQPGAGETARQIPSPPSRTRPAAASSRRGSARLAEIGPGARPGQHWAWIRGTCPRGCGSDTASTGRGSACPPEVVEAGSKAPRACGRQGLRPEAGAGTAGSSRRPPSARRRLEAASRPAAGPQGNRQLPLGLCGPTLGM